MEFAFNLNLSDLSLKDTNRAVSLDSNILYDVLIVGGGPAGLTAAVYCMRKGLKTGFITLNIGGQMTETSAIENYMGYRYIEGSKLVEKFIEQVKQFGIGYGEGIEAASIDADGIIKVNMKNKNQYKALSLIIASGKSYRRLNIPGEDNFIGKGVAYCATCDAPLYKGRNVLVVGGGNSGVEAGIDLAKIAEKVTLIQFIDKLTADQVLQDKLLDFKNVSILFEHQLIEIKGSTLVESAIVKSIKTGEEKQMDVGGIFVEIGLIPNSNFVGDVILLNKFGEIVVDCACRTNVPGIFAAGDVTSVPFKQIIIAAGEGAKAALSANDYVMKRKKGL